LLTLSPANNAEGISIGVAKIAPDITERKHAEALRILMTGELTQRPRGY
jgi:hypothetical protein